MIGDHRRREESGHLEPAVTVRRTHHGNLDAHVAQSSDAVCPVSFDWGAPLELEAEFGEELNGGVDVFYHDADVVHTLDRHDVSLASNAEDNVRLGAPARYPNVRQRLATPIQGHVPSSPPGWHCRAPRAEHNRDGGASPCRATGHRL